MEWDSDKRKIVSLAARKQEIVSTMPTTKATAVGLLRSFQYAYAHLKEKADSRAILEGDNCMAIVLGVKP